MEILIGREKECAAISGLISQRKSIIIFGPAGTGKTAIINKVLSGFTGLDRFYSSESKTLKESLPNFLRCASCDKKAADGANILALKKLFYGVLAKDKPEYIIFDHIGRVEPKYYSFLVYLIDKEIPLIIIARGLGKKDIGHLRMSAFNFEKVEISNLDKSAADILVNYFIEEFGIKITKQEEFKKQVFHFSKGNPKIIKGLCFLARDIKYQKSGSLDVKLMDLDRRISEVVH